MMVLSMASGLDKYKDRDGLLQLLCNLGIVWKMTTAISQLDFFQSA